MPQPASVPVEEGVIDVLKNVSRRPIEPTLASDLVADLGFDSLQVLEVIAEVDSAVHGPKGNVERFVHARRGASS